MRATGRQLLLWSFRFAAQLQNFETAVFGEGSGGKRIKRVSKWATRLIRCPGSFSWNSFALHVTKFSNPLKKVRKQHAGKPAMITQVENEKGHFLEAYRISLQAIAVPSRSSFSCPLQDTYHNCCQVDMVFHSMGCSNAVAQSIELWEWKDFILSMHSVNVLHRSGLR